MYCDSTWQNVKPGHKLKVERETNKSLKSIDPYASAIKIKHQLFNTFLTVGHIPREISRHCYLFIEAGGNITTHLIFTTYTLSSIPAGGLDVLLLLTFSVKSERIYKVMKSFFNDLWQQLYWREGRKQRGIEWWQKNWCKNTWRGECNKRKKQKCYWNRLFIYAFIFISNSTWFEKKKRFSVIVFPELVSKKLLFR